MEDAGNLGEGTMKCDRCDGRGWTSGALRAKLVDGTRGIDASAYPIKCQACGGTGRCKPTRQ